MTIAEWIRGAGVPDKRPPQPAIGRWTAKAVALLFTVSATPASATKQTITSRTFQATTLTFDASCAPGRRAIIAAVGDLLFHDALQAQALRPGRTFQTFWAPVADILASADLTYGNLESPIAEGVRAGGYAHKDPGRVLDRVVYGRKSDALVFNTHPSVAADLAVAGFDVVSIANNHTADRGLLGMDRTLDALNAAGLAHTGVRRSSKVNEPAPWSTRTTTANGITVAWLACTYGLNGMPDPKTQVLQCYRDREIIFDEIRRLASDAQVDAVVLTPHWGSEGAPTPLASDRIYARDAVNAGATAVIGTHPHVLQPWEKHISQDGREGLIIYSTGNFISNQQTEDQRTGVIALLELTKPHDGAPTRLSAAGFVPTFVEMANRQHHRVVEQKTANASVKRLPAGNRVASTSYPSLPRACAPPASTVSAEVPVERPSRVARADTSGDTASRVHAVASADKRLPERSASAIPTAPGGLFALSEAREIQLPSPRPFRPERAPRKQDPVRTARWRTTAHTVLSTPELVSARLLWHVPQRSARRTQAQWIAPSTHPAASPSRPLSSRSASSRSKSRPTKPRKASRSTPTRSNQSSTSRRR